MAISFVASTKSVTLTGVEPTGTQQNDIMVALVQAATSAPTGPAGWTQIGSTFQGVSFWGNVWYIVRGASAPALTWGGGGTSPATDIVTYRGPSTSSPIDVVGGTTDSAVSPSISPVNANDMLLSIYGSESTQAATVPAGMTLRSQAASWNYIASLQLTSSGATGTKTWGSAGTPIGAWAVALTETVPVVVTPATLSLTTTRFAPTARVNKISTPAALALTTTRFAPTAPIGKLFTPAAVGLALTGFAPSVPIGKLFTPGVASLILTAFAPAVLAPVLVRPGPASLVIVTFAPVIIATNIPRPVPLSIPLWTKGLYKPQRYPPLRYAPLRFKPPRYRKPF